MSSTLEINTLSNFKFFVHSLLTAGETKVSRLLLILMMAVCMAAMVSSRRKGLKFSISQDIRWAWCLSFHFFSVFFLFFFFCLVPRFSFFLHVFFHCFADFSLPSLFLLPLLNLYPPPIPSSFLLPPPSFLLPPSPPFSPFRS